MTEEQETREYVERRIQRELNRKAYREIQRQVDEIERDDKNSTRHALIALAIVAVVFAIFGVWMLS